MNDKLKIIDTKIDNRKGIVFKLWIKLSNGASGKIIEIDDIKTHYIISPNSDVINVITGKVLKPIIGKHCQYKVVNIQLGKRGYYKTVTLHRLLAKAYIQNIENKPIVNHKDGNKFNLDLSNLEWSTYSENNIHAFNIGLKKPSITNSEDCIFTTHTKEDVVKVCELLKTGMRPTDIFRKYPELGYDFILNIRSKRIWKEITSKYEFPFINRYKHIFSDEEILKLNDLFSKNYSVRDAINEMNWEFNEKIRGRVKYYKKRFELSHHHEAQLKPL